MLLNIHSQTSLITNSSTTIFTNSIGSDEAAKKLIDEFFKTFDLPYKCDDCFRIEVIYDDGFYYSYLEHNNELEILNFDQLYNDICDGNIPKPDWFLEAEKESSEGYSGYLYISPKDDKYKNLAIKLKKFLYSWSAEEGYDG